MSSGLTFGLKTKTGNSWYLNTLLQQECVGAVKHELLVDWEIDEVMSFCTRWYCSPSAQDKVLELSQFVVDAKCFEKVTRKAIGFKFLQLNWLDISQVI